MAFTRKTDFTFKHVNQADEPVYADPATLKTSLDSQSKELRDYNNDTLLTELEGTTAAENIGIDSPHGDTLQEFIDYVEAAGTGTAPSADSVTNDMLHPTIKIGALADSTTTDTSSIIAITNEINSKASASNPMDTEGDMIYRNSTVPVKLSKGTEYQELTMNTGATAPNWSDGAKKLLDSIGSILYASAANTLAKLAKGTAYQGLRMNSAETAPEWGNVMIGEKQIFTADGTFTAPKTGVYKVTVIGGGGSGGRTGSSSNVYASAGGAGGIAIKWVSLTKDDSITVTRGAGGAAYTTSSSSGHVGNNGGTSSFAAHCSATGGDGGNPSASGSSGATGGNGSGGDINIQSPVGQPTFQATVMFPAPYVGTAIFGLLYGKGGTGTSGLDTNGTAGGDGAVIVEW